MSDHWIVLGIAAAGSIAAYGIHFRRRWMWWLGVAVQFLAAGVLGPMALAMLLALPPYVLAVSVDFSWWGLVVISTTALGHVGALALWLGWAAWWAQRRADFGIVDDPPATSRIGPELAAGRRPWRWWLDLVLRFVAAGALGPITFAILLELPGYVQDLRDGFSTWGLAVTTGLALIPVVVLALWMYWAAWSARRRGVFGVVEEEPAGTPQAK